MSQNPESLKTNAATEKSGSGKTFYYLASDDRVQGPFTLQNLAVFLQQGRVSESTLVWSSEVNDWTPIEEIPELQLMAIAGSGISNQNSITEELNNISLALKSLEEPAADAAEHGQKQENPFLRVLTINRRKAAARAQENSKQLFTPGVRRTVETSGPLLQRSSLRTQLTKDPLVARLLLISFFALVIFGVGNYFLSKDGELGHWRDSKLITESEFQELRAKREMAFRTYGAQGAIQLVERDLKLLIATNLPDQSRLKISMSSLPGKIIGAYFYGIEGEAIPTGGAAVVDIDSFKVGNPPPGEYKITVSCLECPEVAGTSNSTIVTEKNFLIGVDPQSYQQRLGAFHLSARKKLQEELDELRQLIETVSGQFDETVNSFSSISSPKEWESFSNQWQTLQTTLSSTLQRYDLRNEGSLFHNSLYQRTLEAMKLSSHLHKLHDSQMRTLPKQKSREIQDLEQLIHLQITGVWAKVTRAQKELSDSTALPSRPD